MTDFFREVDEEVRRERVIALWTKYRYAIIGVAILVVAATGAWRAFDYVRAQKAAEAGAKYETALKLARDGRSTEAVASFEVLAKEAPKGYAGLARLRAADEIALKDAAAGLAAYEALAADNALDPKFQDVARLRAAYLRVDRDDPKDFEQKYGPLAGSTFTYRHSLRELLGLAALKRGDTEAAGRWFDAIAADQQAPGSLRQRAEAFLSLVQAAKPAQGQTSKE